MYQPPTQPPTQPPARPSQPLYPPQQQQRPGNWFTRLGRPAQVGIGCLALIVICGLCGGISSLITNANGGNTTASTSTSTDATQALQATHAPTATPKPKAWVTVHHFSGTGNEQTDSFDVKDGDHVVSNCTTNSEANLFIADLYADGTSAGNDFPYAQLVDRANEPCSKQTYTVHEGDAKVYLHVESDSITWTIDVQRYQ